jgi:hypothetical protein
MIIRVIKAHATEHRMARQAGILAGPADAGRAVSEGPRPRSAYAPGHGDRRTSVADGPLGDRSDQQLLEAALAS